ncbi:MAG: S-adenosylmethionine:tRNA ribosyltransferase-isomerase [marine bacterium B5-7]|nr:MAG: S-adenosylmethionine:tRNA ribosyltransferase-isomerase [marine bacterium B5-7]
MNLDEFDYILPPERIAQRPVANRCDGRLLYLRTNGRSGSAGSHGLDDRLIIDLPGLLKPGDLVIINDTRVLPARCLGRKIPGGGNIEIFLERTIDDHRALVQLGTSKKIRIDQEFEISGHPGRVESREGDFFVVRFDAIPVVECFEQFGRIPLPPYIARNDDSTDQERYQTVFARYPGAVAAPTAGLHFDQDLVDALDERGVKRAALTLHVGAGTFQPVRVSRIEEHQMHAERFRIDHKLVDAINSTRQAGGRVVAIGTTVARALESAACENGTVSEQDGETTIFIYPGYRFKVVDVLLTNFHLPKSTLLMMVCAFGEYQRVIDAYHHAIENNYRFYSYGDAMLIEPMTDGCNRS